MPRLPSLHLKSQRLLRLASGNIKAQLESTKHDAGMQARQHAPKNDQEKSILKSKLEELEKEVEKKEKIASEAKSEQERLAATVSELQSKNERLQEAARVDKKLMWEQRNQIEALQQEVERKDESVNEAKSETKKLAAKISNLELNIESNIEPNIESNIQSNIA